MILVGIFGGISVYVHVVLCVVCTQYSCTRRLSVFSVHTASHAIPHNAFHSSIDRDASFFVAADAASKYRVSAPPLWRCMRVSSAIH